MKLKDLLRFIDNIEFDANETGCWLWRGPLHAPRNDYGEFHFNNRNRYPHRIAYALWNGPLCKGLTIDHLIEAGICSSKLCVNPDHLDQVTRSENMFRRYGSTSEKCRNGHLRSEHSRIDKWSKRLRCMECHRLTKERYEWRNS